MAFQTQSANTVRPFSNANNNTNKADGFINIYLPTKGGERRKLGAIALKSVKPAELELLQFLSSDEGNINVIASKLEIDYKPAGGTESSSFDLS